MKIQLTNIGKRYNNEWIFRGLSKELGSENKYVILGANGSGKSTLLQVLAGSFFPSEGKIKYFLKDKEIEAEKIFRQVSIATPYLELIEEFTLKEIIDFQGKFKPVIFDTRQAIEIMRLEKSANKAIRYYSSGMKQRVKLGLAILSNTPMLLLDEPVSNLDRNGIEWYQGLIRDYCRDKLVIVCSNNQKEEFFMCNEEIRIEDYKKTRLAKQ